MTHQSRFVLTILSASLLPSVLPASDAPGAFILPTAGQTEVTGQTEQPASPGRKNRFTDALANLADEAIDVSRRRLLRTDTHTPWQIMHGLLALRHEFKLIDGERALYGIDWISDGPTFEGEHWFQVTPYGGRAHPFNEPYKFEGHANQFLAILSMSGLALDHQFQTDRGPITVRDMVNNAKMEINDKEEVTWSLWALSRYLPSNARWTNKNGEPWSIERLVQVEVEKKTQGAPCGGTHGLFALSHARNIYLRSGKRPRGAWLAAEYKINKHIRIVQMTQNRDGMPSTKFFEGREYDQDFNTRIASAGHLLEFLMIALPQRNLQDHWVRAAVAAVSRDLIAHRREAAKCGPMYHAVNGLVIYLERTQPQFVEQLQLAARQRRSTPDSRKAAAADVSPETPKTENEPRRIAVKPQATRISRSKDVSPPVTPSEPNKTVVARPESNKSVLNKGDMKTVEVEIKTAEKPADTPQTPATKSKADDVPSTDAPPADAGTADAKSTDASSADEKPANPKDEKPADSKPKTAEKPAADASTTDDDSTVKAKKSEAPAEPKSESKGWRPTKKKKQE